MKNIIFTIAIISAAFISCDGRKSHIESLQKSISEFSGKQINNEIVSIYPREYTEVVTDTIISNKVKVHIKNYSLLDETILLGSTINNINYHRVFEAEIVISSLTKDILRTTVSAEKFKDVYDDEFWNNATLQHVWVNQELSTLEHIQLDVSFMNPKEKSHKLYRMSIDKNGQQQFSLIEEQS